MDAEQRPKFYTAVELANVLGLLPQDLTEMLREGRLPNSKIVDGVLQIPELDASPLIRAREEAKQRGAAKAAPLKDKAAPIICDDIRLPSEAAPAPQVAASSKSDAEFYREGFVAFRHGIRDALWPFYQSNPGSTDEELINAVARLVNEEDGATEEELAKMRKDVEAYVQQQTDNVNAYARRVKGEADAFFLETTRKAAEEAASRKAAIDKWAEDTKAEAADLVDKANKTIDERQAAVNKLQAIYRTTLKAYNDILAMAAHNETYHYNMAMADNWGKFVAWAKRQLGGTRLD